MNTLNLGSDEIPATKKKSNTRNLKIALGLAAVILVPTIGSTLAGSIAINTNANVEFGQGLAQTAACDPDGMTLTPDASFTNAAGAGSFGLGTIAISGIDDACEDKTFTITAYNNTGAALTIANTNVGFTYEIISGTPNTCTPTEAPSGNYTLGCVFAAEDDVAVTITLAAGVDAEDVYKFTVETA